MERGALQQIQEKVRQTLAYLRGGTCETKITSSFSLSLLVTQIGQTVLNSSKHWGLIQTPLVHAGLLVIKPMHAGQATTGK